MIAATQATLATWNRLQPKDRARTLAASRFVDFTNGQNDDWRRRTSDAIRHGSKLDREKLAAWRSFVLHIAGQNPESEHLLFARLQSRLMVNMAGGVFENGGICLDHTSGVPFIPGSAVKGCARRMAIQELLELVTHSEDMDLPACAAPSHHHLPCLRLG